MIEVRAIISQGAGMKTGINLESQTGELRRWAADQLGTSPDAPTTEARAAFLQLLRDADFVPPTEWHLAYKVLAADETSARAAVVSDPNVLRDVQDRLRAEIDEFTGEFFDLPPAERRSRWRELKSRTVSFRSLSAWLDALSHGLDADKNTTLNGSPQLERLYEVVLQNFVLRPTEAAWHRQRFIHECQAEIAAYQYAAQQLQKRFPALAALAPDLVTQLATWSKAQQQREARRKKLRASLMQAPSYSAEGATGEKPKEKSRVWIAIVIIVVLNLLRIVFSESKPTPKFSPLPPTQSAPSYRQPVLPAPRYIPPALPPETSDVNSPWGDEVEQILREVLDRRERNRREGKPFDSTETITIPFDLLDPASSPQGLGFDPHNPVAPFPTFKSETKAAPKSP
jgi:hypothetical protein